MDNKFPNYQFIYLESVDSTNSYMKKLLREKHPEEYTVILADYQQSGRGQGKKSWHGKKGQNLSLSILFRPDISAFNHFFLAEIAALALTDLLSEYGIPAKIKWPNDIYVGDKKIAGILIENSLESDIISTSIMGIGLNVNETDFPDFLPNPVSMRLLLNRELAKEKVAELLLAKLHTRYLMIIEGQFTSLHKEYNNRLYRQGKETEYRISEGIFKATLTGVETSGEMTLQMQDKELKKYLFGEIQMVVI